MGRAIAVLLLFLAGVVVWRAALFRAVADEPRVQGDEPRVQGKVQREPRIEGKKDRDAGDAFAREIRPLLDRRCQECHGEKEPQAGLSFSGMQDQESALTDRRRWEKIRDRVAARMMPPPDRDPLTSEERIALLAWIDREALKVDCSAGERPGRGTIRRLTRAEYRNTVRDLTGIDFEPTAEFPADEVGYGFDNIGDLLSVSPLLMEKYVAAAQGIVDQALALPPDSSRRWRIEAEVNTHRNTGGPFNDTGWNLTSVGEVIAEVELPEPGRYAFRARAFGQQAGPAPCRMEFRVNGRSVKTVDVKVREDSPRVFEVTPKISAAKKHQFSVRFTNDYYKPDDPNPDNRDRNLIIDYLELEGPIDKPPPDPPAAYKKIMIARPEGGEERVAAWKILRQFGSRAFRRPLTDEELDRLVKLFEAVHSDTESFDESIKLPLAAVLASPHFLFRVERDREADRADRSYTISDFELATRLSYFLWSTYPDSELFAVTHGGRLRQGKTLQQQARRMLRNKRSRALVENFAVQWLQLRNLNNVAPDKGRYGGWSEELRADMREETLLFMAEAVREDRSVLELLDSDHTFVNERLARHYGIAGVTGDEFQRVELSDGRRGGLLTQASVLTITSNPTRTSPVKRGKWIMETILGTPPPPPPPNVPELKSDQELTGTLRQRMEQHRQNPVCASCHTQMDALGFGLENFDGIGAWRDQDGGQPIDASGELPGNQKFQGPAELRKVLLQQREQFVRSITEKLMTYALGRGLEYYDRCAVDRIVQRAAADDYRFSSLILGVIESDAFQRRELPGETP